MTAPAKEPVALFGLGLMGAGMAKSLLAAGYPLAIYNRTAEKAAPFVAEGARSAETPKQAAEGARVLIGMVADDAASRAVWLGEEGALAGAASGAVVVEASTLGLEWVKELGAAAAAKGCDFLDAPVTGSRDHAAAGQLTFLVGGSAEALGRVRPVLDAMSKAVVHMGGPGSGCLMKLVNNFVCGVQAASLAEAVALIEKSGLDRDAAAAVLTNGAPGSPLVKTLLPRMTGRDYDPHFHLELMAKDLAYAGREGEQAGLSLKTVAAARELFERAKSEGGAGRDFSAVVESLRKD